MTVRNRLFTVLSSLLVVFAVSTFALAQETTTKQDDSGVKATKEGRGFGKRGGKDGKFAGKFGRKGHGKGFGHRGFGRGGFGTGMRGFHKLNLTEDQKTQMKTLHETFKAGNQANFDEMKTLFQQKRDKTITADGEARMKVLREQMKAGHEQLRANSLNVLTAEQKTELETMKAERKQKMEERRKLWEQRKAERAAQPKTTEN